MLPPVWLGGSMGISGIQPSENIIHACLKSYGKETNYQAVRTLPDTFTVYPTDLSGSNIQWPEISFWFTAWGGTITSNDLIAFGFFPYPSKIVQVYPCKNPNSATDYGKILIRRVGVNANNEIKASNEVIWQKDDLDDSLNFRD